jgi:hypothetical protein
MCDFASLSPPHQALPPCGTYKFSTISQTFHAIRTDTDGGCAAAGLRTPDLEL